MEKNHLNAKLENFNRTEEVLDGFKIIFTHKTKDVKIFVQTDTDYSDPTKEFDLVGQMRCWHSRYDLGHESTYPDRYEQLCFERDAKRKRYEVLPLYLYDHSFLHISTTPFNCRWDSGQVGWVFVTPEVGRAQFGRKWRAAARQRMVEDVALYDEYISGNVWGYRIEVDGEEVDACWGIFGDYDEINGALYQALESWASIEK